MHRRLFLSSLVAGSAALAGGPAAGSLAEHRITRIEAKTSHDRYARFVGRNAKGNPAGRGFGRQIRILTTDGGARGGGMSHVPDDQVEKFVGARVSDLFDLQRGAAEEAYGIDLPLHDLAGTILGKPVYALLGAKGPTEVPVYSGAIYFDDLEPPEKPRGVPGVVASCQQDYDAGYRAFKLKIGRGFKWIPGRDGLQRDIAVTRAVREAFPDCKILVDANDAYDCEQFLSYLEGVKDCDLFCIEEPFRENRDDLARLQDHMARAGCRALIMEGEGRTDRAETPWRYGDYSRRHVDTLYELAREKLVHVFNLDLAIVGFTRWREVMPELAAADVQASPHTWAGTPRPFYAAHLAAGVGNVLIVEGIPGTATGMDYAAHRFVDGRLVLADLPGFGLRFTF